MPGQAVTLFITNSIDYVADLLVKQLGSEHFFRYNTDLWKDYRLLVSDETIEIEDPTGRRVTETDIVKVYRRSSMRASTIFPALAQTDAERYAEEEVWMALTDVLNIFWEQGKVVLNQPLATMRSCKMQQMRIAAKYFTVTPFRFVLGSEAYLRPGVQSVAKSFTFKVCHGVGFYARKVTRAAWTLPGPGLSRTTSRPMRTSRWCSCATGSLLFRFRATPSSPKPSDCARRPPVTRTAAGGPSACRRISNGPSSLSPPRSACTTPRLDFLKKGQRYSFLEANYSANGAGSIRKHQRPHGQNPLRNRSAHAARRLSAAAVALAAVDVTELHGNEMRVQRAGPQKLSVGALPLDAAAVEHHQPVRRLDRCKTVRHDSTVRFPQLRRSVRRKSISFSDSIARFASSR